MIRIGIIKSIVKKDFLDALRDPQTLISNYLVPLVFWPVGMTVFSGLILTEKTLFQPKTHSIAIVGEAYPEFTQLLKADKRLAIKDVPVVGVEIAAALQKLKEREKKDSETKKETKINRLLAYKWTSSPEMEYFDALLKKHELGGVLVVEKGNVNESGKLLTLIKGLDFLDATGILEDTAMEFSLASRQKKSKELKMPISHFVPLIFKTQVVTVASGMNIGFLGKFIPFVLLFILTTSATQLAMNSIVEEREKGTLALLWSAPLRSMEIVLAKFFHVVVGSLSSLSLNALSMGLGFFVLKTSIPMTLTVASPFQLVCFVICIAISIGSLAMAAGSLAKNRNQGGGILSVMMILVIIIAINGGGAKLSLYTSCIPFFNALLGAVAAIEGGIAWPLFMWIILCNVVSTAFLILLANQFFKVASSGAPFAISGKDLGLKTIDPHLHQTLPGIEEAAVLILLGFFAVFYLIAGLAPLYGIPIMQIGVFGLLPISVAFKRKLNLSLCFNFRKTNFRSIVGAIIAGIFLPLLALALASLIPFPEESKTKMGKLFELVMDAGGWFLLIGYLAFLPAVFEELFFRGIIFNGFRKALSPVWAVTLTSLVFGVFHLNPIQIAFTTFVGFFLAAALLRSGSVFVTMILHFLYNTSVLSISALALKVSATGSPIALPKQTVVLFIVVGLTGTVLGFFCFKREKN